MVDINPAVAFQTSDGRFAVGVGADYRRARIMLNRNNGATNPFTQRFTDVANVYLSSDWDSAWGWNAGVLFKPSDKFRIGAAYRAPMDIDFSGDATFTQIPTGYAQFDAGVKALLPPNQRIKTTLPTPAVAQIGVATGVVPNWDLEFDVTHTTWSRFKTLSVEFPLTPQINLNRPQNWNDTYSYRLGANHPVTPDWDVRLGILYDENPQPTEAVSPLLPDSDRRGLSFGLGYHGGPWIVDASVFLLHFDSRNTFGKSTDLNGEYSTEANLLSLNLGYRF
jgi:long-chain fatty acid transport protein